MQMSEFAPLQEWFKENALFSRRDGHPLVTLTYAQSIDGSITHHRGAPLSLSGPATKKMTHWLRSQHKGILVGINTVMSDDPRLTVTEVEGESPQPVILDSHLRTPLKARIFSHPKAPILACCPKSAESERAVALRSAGAIIVPVPGSKERINLSALLSELWQRGMDSLMVEGGAEVITSFLEQRLADLFILTVAPRFVGGLNALTKPIPGQPRLEQLSVMRVGEDVVLWGKIER